MHETQIAPATVSLADHPGLEDIYLLLCSGWPASRVAILIARKYGQPVRTADVQAYGQTIPIEDFLELDVLTQRAAGMDIVIDVVGEMSQLLLLMRDRIEAALIAEDTGQARTSKLDAMIKTYFQLLDKYADALQRFGITSGKAAVPQEGEHAETLRELLEGKRAVSQVHPPALHPEGVGGARLLRSTNN